MKAPPDLSRAAFRAALARNGLRPVLLWIEDVAVPGASYGMTLNHQGKILRRASLARALQLRAKRQGAEA